MNLIRHMLLKGALLAVIATTTVPAFAQSRAITEEEARAIGVEAYLYFYPLVTMDIIRRQAANAKDVVRPRFDTLSSNVWLDLTREPVVVSVPDTGGRDDLLSMLDMWSDVVSLPGWRATGARAADFLMTPPGWTGPVPDGFTRIDAPTPYVWIIGRTKTDGPADGDAAPKIQAGFKVTPLSRWGKAPEPIAVKVDPTVDMKTPPKLQVDTMSADRFFTYAVELLKVNPPHGTDQPILARMKRIGIEPGKSLGFDRLDPAVRHALASVPAEAHKVMSKGR